VTVSRRLRLTVVALGCALALAQAGALASGAGAGPRLTDALRGQGLSLGRTAAVAVDSRTGAVLYAHNAERPVRPASTEKVPVSWAALTRLGTGFRFRTEVLGAGRRVGSTWKGDLVLKGYGDPTLAARDVARLAAAVRRSGITRITGWVRGDESVYDARRDAPGWKRSFVGIESPPLSALVVDSWSIARGAGALRSRRRSSPRARFAPPSSPAASPWPDRRERGLPRPGRRFSPSTAPRP
jgi:D-alanyl-D-alanine carboxypeptidase